MDTYLTLSASGEAVYTEKRSKFYAFAEHVDDEESAKARVAALRKQFYDARHVCFAYVLDFDGQRTRSNDDGEPSGTAGRPILGALRSAGLTFTLAVVVRYFGGVKLGTGGLVVAYREAAAAAIAEATVGSSWSNFEWKCPTRMPMWRCALSVTAAVKSRRATSRPKVRH